MKSITLNARVAPVVARPTRPLAILPKQVRHWMEIAKQRRALAEMSDAQLFDLGITRSEAETEAARPFWDSRR